MTLINADGEYSNTHKLTIEEQLRSIEDRLTSGVHLSKYELSKITEQLIARAFLNTEKAKLEKEITAMEWQKTKEQMAIAARSLFTPLDREALEKSRLVEEAEAALYAKDKAKEEAEAARLNKEKAENDLKASENNKQKSRWTLVTTIVTSVAAIAAILVAGKMGKDIYDNQYSYLDGLIDGAGDGLLTSVGEGAIGQHSITL